MFMKNRIAIAVVFFGYLSIAFPTLALGSTPSTDGYIRCRNNIYAEQGNLRLAKISKRGGAPGYFDWPECGRTLSEICREGFVYKRGRRVIVGAVLADKICVASDHGNIGWIHRGDATLIPLKAMSTADWVGHWAAKNKHIIIRKTEGRDLSVVGHARWVGGRSGTINYGGFSGRGPPMRNHLRVSQGDCKVQLTRIGEWLVVGDNHQCGGQNVNTDGLYQRRAGTLLK